MRLVTNSLSNPQYHKIEEKHSEKIIEYETLVMTAKDLDKYYKALDSDHKVIPIGIEMTKITKSRPAGKRKLVPNLGGHVYLQLQLEKAGRAGGPW